jgi:hypothetical protein
MEKLLALSIGPPDNPNKYPIQAPAVLPTGGENKLQDIVGNAVELFLIVAIALALLFTILSGIRWITSGGDEKQLERARNSLKYSIVGLIVALSAFFLISFIGNFFRVSVFTR